MKVEIKVPAMGESISEATIGQIIKKEGSKVAAEDELLELETDKVNQVLYAPNAGIFTLTVKPEETVKIGQVIGYIDTEGTEATAPPAPKEAKPEVAKEEPKKEPPKPVAVESVNGGARISKDEFLESPRKEAPKPAAEKKPAERVVEEVSRPVLPPEGRSETRKKMPKIRQVIAKRLVEAQQTTAMLTTFNEIDMTTVMALRDEYKDVFLKKHGVKLGFMSFFVKASVAALQAIPDINSYIDGDEIVRRWYYDIGIAVGTEKGLFVPVVRDCDHLSFAEIEKALLGYANKAREGRISIDDLQGGGFTITNGGVYGSLLSTPILNPPQSAILGMHKIEKRAVVIDDQIVIRPMMYVALSYDHRIVDGKEAVTFLVNIKNILEDPSRLILEV